MVPGCVPYLNGRGTAKGDSMGDNDTAETPWEVGMRATVTRKWCGSVVHAHTATVERLTPTRAYIGPESWIDRRDGRVLPRYLDYTTTAERVTS